MSAPVVVGYTATDAGADAVALGARLARATGEPLELVLVLPGETRSVITPPDSGYDRLVRERAQGWLDQARETLLPGREHRSTLRYGESFADGLLSAAHDLGASFVVVGAANGGLRGRHFLGSVASELLHSADVPAGPAPPVARVTAAIGSRPGADALLDAAVALAAAASVPLRLVSLETIDLPAGLDTGAIGIVGQDHARRVLEQARAELPADAPVEAVVGSSRLAQPRRLFLGSTAAKMLHVLPVPLIVVPRTLGQEGGRA